MEALSLPHDVATYLATHVRSNVRELEGCLMRLNAFASLMGRPVSVDLARAARARTPTATALDALLTLATSERGIEPITYCRDSSSSFCVRPSRTIFVSSSSIEAIARSTFAGLTPALIRSGPSMTLASRACSKVCFRFRTSAA